MARIFTHFIQIAHILSAYLNVWKFDLATGRLSTWPQDKEVLIDESVVLPCTTTEPYLVYWEHVRCGSRSKQFIYLDGAIIHPYNQRFSVKGNRTEGQYDLEIRSVELADSGRYRCIDMEGQGDRKEAELIVFSSQPLCYCHEVVGENSCGIEEQDDMRFTCEVSYSGNSVPVFQCDKETRIIEREMNPGTVRYIYGFDADPEIIGSSHFCYSSISRISSTKFYSNVTYAKAQKNDLVIESPGRVTCAVNSSRICEYKWTRTGTNSSAVFRQQTLDIKEPGSYVCEAKCPLAGGRYCELEAVTVTFKSESDAIEEANTPTLLIAICLVVPIVIVSVVVIIILRRKSSRKESINDGREKNFFLRNKPR